ncbi:Unknown protein [Striga hermonthica]|uniref:Uncharacterized protein n=1 Tax=Striga hermonthica TaxID=68872 RepID=A0A9N7RMC6_STRHE|nr:Unknown protein [Striga hermonthica]
MAAYAALVSLVQLLHPHHFPSHLQTPQLDSLFSKARSLQSSLEKISHVPKNLRPTVAQLDSDIRDQIYRAQDLVESFLLDQSSTPYFLRDLADIIETIDPLERDASTIASSLEEDSSETSGGLSSEEVFPLPDSSSGATTTTTKIALGMHDSLRDVSLKQCRLEKFFHTMNRFVEKDELPEGTGQQRRLSVHRNIFVCMKEGYDSAKSVLSTRTLIFPGPYHHHPLPYTLTFDLLRVLDALTVYFIEFPSEILELIHLRLLSLTYNGKLPSQLSRLQKLQTLIVHRHPKIIFIGSSYLPAEVWDMPQLRHLLFMESDFPHPSECTTVSNKNSVLFRNLQSLSDVNAASCTREVLNNMPNLKKLGMWAEKPGDVNFYLDELQHLETLRFTVLNPIPNKSVNFLPQFSLPETLKRLTLSGCGIPWEEMSVIGQLPILEVLKLRELAFQGKGWAPEEGEFLALKFLLLEYVDLKYWIAEHSHFPCLESLIMRHCYKLKEIDFPDIRSIGGLKLIELVDCSPLAVEWAESLEKDNKDKKLKIRTYSSWK